MSAHDDKISSNRRRLFKALSAAPVVMTLRPGSALAAASTYQCLQTTAPSPGNEFYTNTNGTCEEGDTCFVYRQRLFWDLSTASFFYNEATGSQPAEQVASIPAECEALSLMKVALSVDETTYYDIETGLPLAPEDAARIQRTGNVVNLLYPSGSVCAKGIQGQFGLALVVGQPFTDPVSGEQSFQELGLYPQFKPGEVFGGGVNQGITGTCMASIPNNITGGSRPPFIVGG